MGTWVVINGSPRLNGKCARLIHMLKMSIEQSHPEVSLVEYEVGRMDVSGCNGCEFCKTNDLVGVWLLCGFTWLCFF